MLSTHFCLKRLYMARVDELLSLNVWNAQVIYADIQARGYTGGTTVLRDYIQPKRVLRPSKATVRFARERYALRPLPRHRFDTSYHQPRQIGWDAYVDVDGNRYSVPAAYAGQSAMVHRAPDGRFRVMVTRYNSISQLSSEYASLRAYLQKHLASR